MDRIKLMIFVVRIASRSEICLLPELLPNLFYLCTYFLFLCTFWHLETKSFLAKNDKQFFSGINWRLCFSEKKEIPSSDAGTVIFRMLANYGRLID